MRFRRVAAIAVIVAAAGATTAAMLPPAPADRPQPMPALTSRALAARYTANSHRITRAASAARHAGDINLARALGHMEGHHFLDFNPRGQGLAVEVVGILVPGSDTSLTTFDSRGAASPAGSAAALAAQARRLDPRSRLAIIAWVG